MMRERKKDIIFLIVLIVTAAFGFVAVIIAGSIKFVLACLLFSVVSILSLYFNYSFCKFGNRRHGFWNEQNPCDGEPSDFLIRRSKIGAWALYIIALVLPLLPAGLL